jgi:putative transposase
MELELTPKEIATNLGISSQAVNKRARKEAWPAKKRHGRGGGKIYDITALPSDIRNTIIAKRANNQPVIPGQNKPIPNSKHAEGLARYRLIGYWRQYRTGKKPKSKADKAFISAFNSGQLYTELFKVTDKITLKSLYRWDKKLRAADDDYQVLCDTRGWAQADGVQGRIGDDAEEVFLKLWLVDNQPSVSLAYRGMCAVLESRGLPAPSRRSTYRFIERYDKDHHDIVVLMREGEKALKDKVGPYITRDSGILEVGDVIFSDGHRLNFDAIHPLTGRPARMTLICWFDWASRIPVGWEVMPEEDTISIASALYMAIRHLGKYPKVAYIDNGKAFKSKYFSENADLGELDGLYARLGIAVQHSKPYEARTKIVERFFGSFDSQCARLLPSHRGSSVANKPAYLMRNEKFHQARHNNFVPTLAQCMEIFRIYVNWYGDQHHRGINKTPWEIFNAGKGPGVDTTELTRHFLWRKEVTPSRCRVKFAGISYESDALYGLNQKLIAMFSWADMSVIHLYTKDGRYLGPAKPVEALNPLAAKFGTDLDLQKISDANKRQARLKSQTMRIVKEMDLGPEALHAFPWIAPQEERRQPLRLVEKTSAEPPQTEEITQAETKAIEDLQRKYLERKSNQPGYERPEFRTPLDRYSHLFNLKFF